MMMLSLYLAGVVTLAVTGYIAWITLSFLFLKRRHKEIQAQLDKVLAKDPLQIDLELATTAQLLEEMRRRPKPQYILLLPQFEPSGINLNIEVHNLPPHISLGLLKMAHRLASRQQTPEIVQQSEEFFTDPPDEEG